MHAYLEADSLGIQRAVRDFDWRVVLRKLLRKARGVPGRSRTCDLPLRRRLLYPTELQGLMGRIV